YLLCAERKEKQSRYYFLTADTTFTIDNHTFEAFYPGPGHTKDNIVIWFAKEKVLYGGCLVKSTDNEGLGNIADANVSFWPTSIKRVMKQCPHPLYVIPGHFGWENNKSLKHTLKLLKKNGQSGMIIE
ncbi:MAG TPA: hypothetical protein VN922_07005, partial [Bacteroidia bacterium]|nr:hypothetical protein [Bacteroidia bacterium]